MANIDSRPTVRPTAEDKVAAAGSELIGGPIGRRAVSARRWWSPLRIIALVSIGMFALGMVQKAPCYNGGWFEGSTAQYTRACYSDIPHMYRGRGFEDGLLPYFDRLPADLAGDLEFLEYPVLTGFFMQVSDWLTPTGTSDPLPAQTFWMVNAGLLLICAVALTVCVTRTHRNRPWDGLLVALAPALALTATVNWDLLAVALTAWGMLLWSRSRPLAAGIVLGLATAAKLYPALLLGPLLLLCWRAGRWREFGAVAVGAVGSWLAVNLPVMLAAPEGWARFYTFSEERDIHFGSLWLLIEQRFEVTLDDVNLYASVLMLAGCAAIAVLALAAPRRPRLAQLAFLVVALFILTNKVYSPQYVIWLVPLAALARPNWRDFLVWQTGEVLYFLGIWMYLAFQVGEDNRGLPLGGYHLALTAHLLATLYLCAIIVRDVLRPEHDVIRQDGSDDPGGGVLDGAADVFTLRRSPGTPPAPTAFVAWDGSGSPPPAPEVAPVSRET